MSGRKPKYPDSKTHDRAVQILPPKLVALAGRDAVSLYASFFNLEVNRRDNVHFGLAIPEFMHFCSDNGVRSITDIKRAQFDAYIKDLEQQGRPDRHIDARVHALYMFFNDLFKIGLSSKNPISLVQLAG